MTDQGPAVTIAGGGLSGLTAAMRLAERGYEVTLYEQKSWLGGNLGSRRLPDGEHLDVYPHMYLEWYANFWALLADATGEPKEKSFAPFSTVKQLSKHKFPKCASLTDMYSPWHMVQNMFSGVGPPADMFVFGYASIDLLAERFNPTITLDNVDVNAFLNTRPYMTRAASDAFDSFITRVWAIPSYLASAPDFRRYLAYSVLSPNPAFWLPTGSAFTQVIGPLVKAIEALGVTIVTETEITGVSCANNRVTEIGLRSTRRDTDSGTWVGAGNDRTETVENLLLAVPAGTLSRLVRTPVAAGRQSIVEAAPDIAGIVRLRATQVPIIYLFFKHKMNGMPKEPVGLYGSELSLAFTDISQTWRNVPAFKGRTVLAVSSSDTSGLPGTTLLADGQAMLQELAEYLPFRPGTKWGESPDIDWQHTRYESNADSQLFINQTGTDAWRPHASSSHLSNIYLAGDFCNNDVGMTTIESAVTTGLQAARVIVSRNRYGYPVPIIPPERNLLADLGYVWLRYAWAPSVAAASLWSHALSFVKDGCRRRSRSGLPWIPAPREVVPGLVWSKRPGAGAGPQREQGPDSTDGPDGPDGPDGSQGRRWMS
jgi:phytoene dehydrogenase-like protein